MKADGDVQLCSAESVFVTAIATVTPHLRSHKFTNVILHSTATEVHINLTEIDEKQVLEIEDNGFGFIPENIKNDTFGIIGMKQRAALLNAKFSVKSVINNGTIVTVEIPNK